MTNNGALPKLAVLASHPVQYHAPLYREIAATGDVDLTVLYCDQLGLKRHYEARLDAEVEWDIPLLEGYQYRFMRNLARPTWEIPLMARVNPGVVWHVWRGRYDVVLIQGYSYLSEWLAALAAKLRGTPLIFRGEATLKPSERIHPRRLKYAWVHTMLKLADVVLYSCTGNREFFQHYGVDAGKLMLIPCAVDNDFFRIQHQLILSKPASPKAQSGLKENKLYIVSAAAMESHKRLLDIVQAVGQMQVEGLPIGLVLVGNGPQRDEIVRQAESLGLQDVHFPGWVNLKQACAYYASADVFVLASERDNSPKALSEALNFGLPAVCTDVIGTAGDVIIDGENGFLYPAGDVETLTARLRRLLTDAELRRRMGRRSLEISDRWSMQAAARSVVQATQAVLSSEGSAKGQ